MHIAEDIRKACGIADADAHFAFDSAKVADDERRVLLDSVLLRITVKPSPGGRYFRPDRIALVLRPRRAQLGQELAERDPPDVEGATA